MYSFVKMTSCDYACAQKAEAAVRLVIRQSCYVPSVSHTNSIDGTSKQRQSDVVQ